MLFYYTTSVAVNLGGFHPPPKGVVLAKRPYKGPELGSREKERSYIVTRSSYRVGFNHLFYLYLLGFGYMH
jgi:hypothetical protein